MSAPPGDETLALLVEQFLDRREQEPALTPAAFAAEHPEAGPPLLAAIGAALEVLTTLDDGVEPPPDRIGAFTVHRELGRGGMGVVYEVERDGVRFALKRLGVAALLAPHARQRFQREAKALERLRHPGVVAVHEVGTADGLPFLVMDLVDGRPLTGLGPLPWRRAAELCRDIGAALVAVHAAGLCHRDLKPQNVLLGADDRPRIVDFGLVHDAADATLTGTGDLLGTPRYLAPEQASGQPTDARTDVHALGLILAELLTGRPVRAEADRSSMLAAAASGSPPDLRGKGDLPRDLRRIVRTATARRPQWRYPSAAALVADLERVLAGQPARARPPGPIVRGLDAARRRPRLAAAAGAAVVLAGCVAVWGFASVLAGARHDRAQVHFDDAVFAWLAADDAAARRAIDATLREVRDHDGALALGQLLGTADLPAPAGPRARDLLAGIAARTAADWQAAEAAFHRSVDREPACPLAQVLLAEAARRAGHLVEAERELTAAAQQRRSSPALFLALGTLHLARKDPRAAAGSYRRAVELRPDAPAMRVLLARACLAFDAETGLREVEAALAMLPSDDPKRRHEARNLQAALLDKLGRPGDAVPILEQLAAETPGDVRVCFNLAYALDRLLRVREAKQWYERVLAIDAHNQSAALCLVWLLVTTTEDDLRDVDRAEALLLGALERDQGRSDPVQRMVRDFALRTGRVAGIDATLTRLMDLPGTESHHRAALEHLRNNVRSGAPRDGR